MDLKAYLRDRYASVKVIEGQKKLRQQKKRKGSSGSRKKAQQAQQAGGLTIVDDDAPWHTRDSEDEEDRPAVVQDAEVTKMLRMEEMRQQPFRPISEDGSGWVEVTNQEEEESEPPLNTSHLSPRRHSSPDSSPPRARHSSPDLSPPRGGHSSPRRARHSSPDLSPPRASYSSPDFSPPRRHSLPDKSPPRGGHSSPRRARHSSPGFSPPRRQSLPDISPPRSRHSSPDLSPPRRHSSPDLSPPRSPDLSPPRARARHSSPDLSPPRARKSSPDFPPPQARHSRPDLSPPRKGAREDLSPPRRRSAPDLSAKRQRSSAADLSPPRRRARRESPDREKSAPRHTRDLDLSPPRHKARHGTPPAVRQGGLQTAGELKAELAQKREQEMRRLKQLDASVTGKGAETQYRKNGKVISSEELRKQEVQARAKPVEKPLEWGKGLVQKRQEEARQQELEKELQKPFARSKDDPELDTLLRNRVLWGDPMAHLVKKNDVLYEDFTRSEAMRESGFLVPQDIPMHSWLKRGVAPPSNRYDIRPGRHWDGVDRSNGFEKEMFKKQNEKKAIQDHAYRWSVSDM